MNNEEHRDLSRRILAKDAATRRHDLIQTVLIIIGALCLAGVFGYAVALGLAS